MKELVGLLVAMLVSSNVWLWINLWNLKNEHFEFRKRMIGWLTELCQQPSEDGSGKCSEQPANKV